MSDLTPVQYAPHHGRRISFRAYLAAFELLHVLKHDPKKRRLLDIGGGDGMHARFFRCHGLDVDVVDVRAGLEQLTYEGDYLAFSPSESYDLVWASHVAEHLPNPGLFFDKLYHDVRDGGWAVITVPPLKHLMTFSHVTLWNAGLLLIHLVRAGFDARDAHVATYGYNVTVLARKRADRPAGALKNFLPAVTWSQTYFEGRIDFLNWAVRDLPLNAAMPTTPLAQAIEQLSAASPKAPYFFSALDPKSRARRNFYFDPHSRLVCSVG